jgi:hypothetical protein
LVSIGNASSSGVDLSECCGEEVRCGSMLSKKELEKPSEQ